MQKLFRGTLSLIDHHLLPPPIMMRSLYSPSSFFLTNKFRRGVFYDRAAAARSDNADGADGARLSCSGERKEWTAVEGGKKNDGVSEGELELGEVEGDEVRKERVMRRNRGGGNNGESMELLAIPGIGPRNLRKLVDNGIPGVAQLKKLYIDKYYDKSSSKMVEYLQNTIGIIHKNHAESITTFLKQSVESDLQSNPKPSKPRLTFCVEGNISVGKSTFLQRIANETLELRDLVEIVPEPVSKWQDVGPDHFNILERFYQEPQRYAYTFQNYVFVTRLMQERESSKGIKPLRLMERSVFSDRMVFVRAVHEANWMSPMEISIYDSWFDPVVSSLPGLIPDGFIYLRASPDTCHRRMLHRKRSEEGAVTLEYLQGLHEKHESWLFPAESGGGSGGGILGVSGVEGRFEGGLHPDIKDRVFYLHGNHMHESIQKVPALVLDCEPDIDFGRDIDAKRQYARQVSEFFEFVKKKKEVSEPEKKEQIVMPQENHLWVPPQGVPLNPSDLERAMSSLRV